ncbi:MAG: single-stranded DNA-binding protein [Elusimicrobia bacterium]|nr:single-stranded DNA-binding protein [Elusimicrobiota bacterium]
MGSNVNLVILMGNLTRDPELRHTSTGQAVTTLTVAVNRTFKNSKTGNWDKAVDFLPVVVWGVHAENCEKYLSKGSGVLVEGRLSQSSRTTPEGEIWSKIEVVAGRVQFLSRAASGGQPSYRDDSSSKSEEIPDYDEPTEFDDDDDIPF